MQGNSILVDSALPYSSSGEQICENNRSYIQSRAGLRSTRVRRPVYSPEPELVSRWFADIRRCLKTPHRSTGVQHASPRQQNAPCTEWTDKYIVEHEFFRSLLEEEPNWAEQWCQFSRQPCTTAILLSEVCLIPPTKIATIVVREHKRKGSPAFTILG